MGDESQIRKETSPSFYTDISNSKWRRYVLCLLTIAYEIVENLKIKNVQIKGTTPTLCAAISATVKIIIDPFYRRIDGFWYLIHEEFLYKYCFFNPSQENMKNYDSGYEPSLILFLSAVEFILQQYPDQFQFDVSFLVSVADLLPSGLFNVYQLSPEDSDFIPGLNPVILSKFWNRYLNPLYYENFPAIFSCQSVLYCKNLFELDLFNDFFLRWNIGSVTINTHSAHKKNFLSTLVGGRVSFF